jgi:hypothetical protein
MKNIKKILIIFIIFFRLFLPDLYSVFNNRVSAQEASGSAVIPTEITPTIPIPPPNTNLSFQRKTWYDGTHYWISVSDGTKITFSSSADGNFWTVNNNASITATSSDFSIEADEYHAYIAYKEGFDIKVAKASSYPDASFTWGNTSLPFDGSETTGAYQFPSLARDSKGVLFITAKYSSSENSYLMSARCDKPDSVNCTWTENIVSDTGNTSRDIFGAIVPLLSQNMYAVWFTSDTSAIEGKKYSKDIGWDDIASPIAIGASAIGSNLSVVSDGADGIHLFFIDSLKNTVYRRYNNGWQKAVVLDNSIGNNSPSVSFDTTDSSVYVFWLDGNLVYYKKGIPPYSYTSWDVEKTLFYSSGINQFLSSNSKGAKNIFSFWLNGATFPYDTKWQKITDIENGTPLAPSGLFVNTSSTGAQRGEANPVALGDARPVFSAVFNDPDIADYAQKYEIIVYKDPVCSGSPVWDSGETGTAIDPCTEGNRCNDIAFEGASPIRFDGTKYSWKIRFFDSTDTAGAFSECNNFTMLGPKDQIRHGKFFFNNAEKSAFSW